MCAVRVFYKYHVRKLETFVPKRRQNLIPLTGLVYLLVMTETKKIFGKVLPRINDTD
jgi:hypothetical protein